MLKIYKTLFLFLLLSPLYLSQSKNIYVSTTGNDLNTGLIISQPLKSINNAVKLSSPGDTIFLLPGTFREIVKFISKYGAAEKPIYIYGYNTLPGQQAVIDGGAPAPSNSASYYWMQIQNSAWIEVGNIIFKNGWTNPLQIINSSYLTIKGCSFYGGKRVIDATGSSTHHLLIENNNWDQGGSSLWTMVYDSTGMDAWTSMHEGALQYFNGTLVSFIGTGGSVVIRNNTIINAFNGIRWTAQTGYDSNIEIYNNSVIDIRDNDFEPEYYTYNLHIYHNHSHNIHKTMSVDHVQGGNIYYYGNLITSDVNDNWAASVASSFWKVYGAAPNNLSFPLYAFNNSFCGCGKAFANDAGTAGIQIKHFNNAYKFTKSSRTWLLAFWDTTDVFDYDVSNLSWPATIINNKQESHGLITDPLFIDSQKFNLKLQQGSPAIDAGKILEFPDFDWTQSYQGSGPDIGAYEGDNLVDGPAFRFKTASGLHLSYNEKPRIVRAKVLGNKLNLYFSLPLDPASFSISDLSLLQNDSTVNIQNMSMLNDNYLMEIATTSQLTDSLLVFSFYNLPKGSNGEYATLWGAAINVDLKKVVTSVKEINHSAEQPSHFELNIYPNPFNGQTKIRKLSIRICK